MNYAKAKQNSASDDLINNCLRGTKKKINKPHLYSRSSWNDYGHLTLFSKGLTYWALSCHPNKQKSLDSTWFARCIFNRQRSSYFLFRWSVKFDELRCGEWIFSLFCTASRGVSKCRRRSLVLAYIWIRVHLVRIVTGPSVTSRCRIVTSVGGPNPPVQFLPKLCTRQVLKSFLPFRLRSFAVNPVSVMRYSALSVRSISPPPT